ARLTAAYRTVHARMVEHLRGALPRPETMKPEAYERNIAARAFDVARYCLCFGVPTGVGQVVSIRTLERQIRRMRGSEYAEVAELGAEMAQACARPPECTLDTSPATEPIAPTLAKYVLPDSQFLQRRADLAAWAAANLPAAAELCIEDVDLLQPSDATREIAATLLYPVTDRPFRELYEIARSWPTAKCQDLINLALQSRKAYDDLPREFRTATYCFDIIMDIGAYRDLHRHRRCQQYRQSYGTALGFETPAPIVAAGIQDEYVATMKDVFATANRLPSPGSHYLLPFAARGRFLFKMDFAEIEYISRLRSGVKGHFSYRNIAWKMKLRLEECAPELGKLIDATPPWVEDPLLR
ncbi:MAG TPA: FAD-dependent thymidylate synthase, partial [Bryobacteraceae bacterium]|nr:FAD-dependent thymidylate synthase [Bryobacteraceae bacterium]